MLLFDQDRSNKKPSEYNILTSFPIREEKKHKMTNTLWRELIFLLCCNLLMAIALTVKNMFKYFMEGKAFIQEWQMQKL